MSTKKVWFKKDGDWFIGNLIITNDDRAVINYDGENYTVDNYYPYKELDYNNIYDVINLPLLDEPSILESIHNRFNINKIYTNCGEILISVNPFRFTDLYSNDNKILYKQNLLKNSFKDSHIYNNVNKSFYYLSKFNKSQSILISGESGAGKTQSTKIIIDYLTYLSSKDGKTNDIQLKIINSNPILESFGNAKTIKNDNSSRFGKFIKLFFNKNNNICGGLIETFLLEKVRVIKQNPNERNFHIFYEFLNGIDNITMEELKINKYYNTEKSFLQNGLIQRTMNTTDKSQFNNLNDLLNNIGLSPENKLSIWKIIAFIIIIGGYTYELNLDKIQYLASLLNIDITTIMEALYTRRIIVNNESIHSDQTEDEFYNSRDSLVTKLYTKLFDYIVNTINKNISQNNLNDNSMNFIGILDIFGFESLETNSFEQLCINFANETLQNQFNKYSLEQEQKEYKLEEIKWDYIEFNDNIQCINLISGKMGIFKILDEQCKVPNGNDTTFLNRMNKELINNSDYKCNNLHNDKIFSIRHYADIINYDIKDFCDKNKDIATNEIMNIVNSYELFKSEKSDYDNLSRIGSKTISNQFRLQMNNLMSIIEKTGIHYVRCFKPNDLDSPTDFNRFKILEQLKNNGILEAIKVSRHSFPIKYKYDEFEKNYNMIININKIKENKEILDIDTELYQFGKTKIFLKSDAFNKLEIKKEIKINDLVILLQKNIRRYINLILFQLKRWNICIIQNKIRQFNAKCRIDRIRKEQKSIILQKNVRKYLYEKMYNKKIKSYQIIIKFLRNCIKKKRIKSVQIIWKYYISYKKRIYKYVNLIQSNIRRFLLNKKYILLTKGIKKLQYIIRRKLFNTVQLKNKISLIQTKLDRSIEKEIQLNKLLEERDSEILNKNDIISDLEKNIINLEETLVNNNTILSDKDNMIYELNSIIKDLNIKIDNKIQCNKNEEISNENNKLIEKLKKENVNLNTFKKKLFDTELDVHRLKEDNKSYVTCLKKNIEKRLDVQKILDRIQDENKHMKKILNRHGIADEYILL